MGQYCQEPHLDFRDLVIESGQHEGQQARLVVQPLPQPRHPVAQHRQELAPHGGVGVGGQLAAKVDLRGSGRNAVQGPCAMD